MKRNNVFSIFLSGIRYSMGHVVDFLPTFLELAGLNPLMEEDRTEFNNLADNFYRFGDSDWKQMHQDRHAKMKERWEELNQIYQKQGK
jgi:hypothetical protein